MTQSLKIECLVTDLALEGEIASFLVTKEQLTAGLSKKADLVEGKIKESNLPDFIANGFRTVNQKLVTLEEAISDGVQSAKDYSEAYADEKLIAKADLVDGKVPHTQLPSIDQYEGLSEALNGVLEQARRDMIERTDEIQRAKADLGEDGKVVREQLPNYDKIPGLETVVKDILDNKADASDVYTKAETLSTEEIEQTVERISPTRDEVNKAIMMSSVKQVFGFEQEYIKAGGYPFGTVLTLSDGETKVVSIIDNNKTDPNESLQGWTKKFINTQSVFESSLNLPQSIINNGLESVEELLSIASPEEGSRVFIKSFHVGLNKGGGEFVFISSLREINDGGTIINGWKRVDNSRLSLYSFGAKGDGVEDDSDAIINSVKHVRIHITEGIYRLTKMVSITGQLTLIGMGGVLKPNIKSSVFRLQPTSSFSGDGLIIDGSDYVQTWNANHGMYIFSSPSKTERFTLRNSLLKNVYGSGVRMHSKVFDVSNNILINVAGSNWTKDSADEYDNYGDGIHIMSADTCTVESNYIVNEQAFSDGEKVGRGGLIAEFGANNVSFVGNFIQGYDRGIHLELVRDSWVVNNNVSKCNCSIILAAAYRCLIEKNTFEVSKKYPRGIFGLACLYSYNGNSECTYKENTISVTDASYTKAVLFNGLSSIKNIKFLGNNVTGSVETNGGNNMLFSENTFRPFSQENKIIVYSDCSFERNTFYGIQLYSGAIGAATFIDKNRFIVDKDKKPLEVTNPAGSGFRITNNRFILPSEYSIGSTRDMIESYLSTSHIGELSGNVVVGNSSIPDDLVVNILSNKDSASIQKYFTMNPNLYLKGGKDIVTLTYTGFQNQNGRLPLDFAVTTDEAPSNNAFYQTGARVKRDRPSLSGVLEFVTTTGGYAASKIWVQEELVAVNTIVYWNSNVYIATTGGVTSTTAPNHTSGSANNGTVVWKYLGAKAVFRSVGAKGASVNNATGTDNTATTLNSLINSLRAAGVIL